MVQLRTAEMNAAQFDGRPQLGAGAAKRRAPLWLKVGFWGCTVIAIAVALRRFVALVHPSQAGPAAMASLEQSFASRAPLTFVHITFATAFVLVAPVILFGVAKSRLWERLLFPLGAIVGATAYAMSIPAFGGWVERSAVLFFNTFFLFSMARAYRYAQAGRTFE